MHTNKNHVVDTEVLVVDDHPIYLDGLKMHLHEEGGGIKVVGEANQGSTAYHLASELQPNIVLMDLFLKTSPLSGIEATKLIKEHFPHIQVVILSADDSIDSIMGALKAGANGYLLKTVTPRELKEAIASVLSHGSVLNPAVAQKLLTVMNHPVIKTFTPTERELQILALIVDGATNKLIAQELFLSVRTVEAHIHNLFEKLGVSSRTEAVVQAIRIELVESPNIQAV